MDTLATYLECRDFRSLGEGMQVHTATEHIDALASRAAAPWHASSSSYGTALPDAPAVPRDRAAVEGERLRSISSRLGLPDGPPLTRTSR